MQKISIHYTALGFKPTTSWTWVVTHNHETRAPAPFTIVLKMGQSRPLFCYFRSFLVTISIQIEKSVDGVLGIRTRGRRMVGADETMELWRPPAFTIVYPINETDLDFIVTMRSESLERNKKSVYARFWENRKTGQNEIGLTGPRPGRSGLRSLWGESFFVHCSAQSLLWD